MVVSTLSWAGTARPAPKSHPKAVKQCPAGELQREFKPFRTAERISCRE